MQTHCRRAPTAEKLANWRRDHLELNGVTQLDSATKEKLAAWPGEALSISGRWTNVENRVEQHGY